MGGATYPAIGDVAEGIETFEELVRLQASTSIHCRQGWYFARPMVLPEDAAVIRDTTLRAG